MKYQLTITRTEENLNYKEQVERWESENKYGLMNKNFNDYGRPSNQMITNALNVSLTEEQFKAIKLAAFNAFE